ncbi:MAG: 4-hydroxy-tetrahydrodipicolinate reductase [Vulcanimicrobiaceae bacterium]
MQQMGNEPIRVAIAGICGRMGSLVRDVVESAPSLRYVGGLARCAQPEERVYSDMAQLCEQSLPDVLVDFTVAAASRDLVMTAVRAGVRPLIGTSGWNAQDRQALAQALDERGIGGLLVPNFAIGAVLMMRFAAQAAAQFVGVEIVEMHHDAKRDAPSGTAVLTAERIAAARADGLVPVIHSVRLRGLLAHQEVLLGNDGEVLTIRHDTLSRDAFKPGIALALASIGHLRGLHVGLEAVLPEPRS